CACKSSKQHDEDYGKYDSTSATSKTIDSHYGEAKPRESSAPAPRDESKMMTQQEQDFVTKAANGGKFEVEASQIALQKTISGPHRDFAQMMVEDHGRANRELEVLARNKGLEVPAEVDAEHARKLEDLREVDGKDFEQRYHEMQIKAHEDAIAL